MKKDRRAQIRPFILLLALACAFCGQAAREKLELEISSPAAVSRETTDELILTPLKLTREVKDFDLAKELQDYWSGELASRFKGKVTPRQVPLDKDGLFQDEAFWKELCGGSARTLVLTGQAGFSQEVRKAILEKEKGSIQEPFTKEKTWDLRRSTTLEVRFILLAGDSGKIIADRDYSETLTSSNPKQLPVFALHELLQRLKVKFFRDAFGAARFQDRYLLLR